MLLYVLAFIGGVLTIVSPCILPVLPFVFARADQPFRRSGLPMLIGMALTFAGVATVAALAGSWVVRANQYGRYIAIAIFGLMGLALLFPSLAEFLSRPFVRLGGKVQQEGDSAPSVGKSLLLGVSTGLLWAPCAGPILGLILTGAAVEGASARSAFLLLAFALGAATSLALALLAGKKVFTLMKRSLGAEEWIRRGLGVAVLLGVVAIASGLDTGLLTRVSLASTSGIEQRLVDRFRPGSVNASGAGVGAVHGATVALGNEGAMPSLDGAVSWLNSPPLTNTELRGKVVVIDFWTYSCINCLRSIPYVEAWAEKYKSDGLVVIGVHTPEFAFEKDPTNVAKAVEDLKITYPVALDSNYAIWKAFNNQYWPAHYFIDANGVIRYHHFGEGEYDESERVIQELLKEKNANLNVAGLVDVKAAGAEAAADLNDVQSPETYVGYARGQNFAGPQDIAADAAEKYSLPQRLNLNQWGLEGKWEVSDEHAALVSAPGSIVFRFHARDLHLVLGPGPDGKPVRFRVLLDGGAPLENHGMDIDENGDGVVRGYRLYQLIRQQGKVEDRTFEIQFLDPGVQAYAFTFG
jgi:cytochrome c biogenesis protein CcdA/thiol-disulfide isomerase/thioredoxin